MRQHPAAFPTDLYGQSPDSFPESRTTRLTKHQPVLGHVVAHPSTMEHRQGSIGSITFSKRQVNFGGRVRPFFADIPGPTQR